MSEEKQESRFTERAFDRRTFFKGAAVVGGSAAMAGLAACGPAPEAAPAEGEAATPAGGAGDSRPWETTPEPITGAADGGTYDIVIIGAGIAGNAAAEAASTNGASVVVLEQAETFTCHGVDCGHIGSQWQLANGININPDEAAKLVFRWSQQTANYDLIRQWAHRSGKVFDYLEQLAAEDGITMVKALSPTAKYGWEELDEIWRAFPDAVSFVREGDGMMTTDGQTVNYRIINRLNENAIANGAEFIYNTHVEQLVQDGSGAVTGVVASGEDGAPVAYNATKAVILATGDIGGNDAMIEQWSPITARADASFYAPPGGNMGDGMTMGIWAGAAPSKSPAAPMVHQIDMGGYLTAIEMSWLAVNNLGKRYGAEMPIEPMITNARMNQPNNISWSIFDGNFATYVEKQLPTTFETALNPVDMMSGEQRTAQEQIDSIVEAGHIIKGDSLEDLASQLGIPADNFAATVERYNSWYDSGVDGDFGVPARFLTKVDTPPFYAQPIAASLLVCIMGLHVNNDSQVCDNDDNPIPGLFAVGNMQGDFFGNSYPVHCPGISHGRALTFGHLVGEALAQDTLLSLTE